MAKGSAGKSVAKAPAKNTNASSLTRIQKAESAAATAQARADVARARATMERAKVEASGKQIVYDYKDGRATMKIVDRAK